MASKDEKKEPNPPKSNAKPYGRVLLTLKNQLLPEDKLTITPSQNDGLSLDAETDLRIYGCELIQTAGILLKLPQVAMATGQVLLQRFYYTKSLVRHPVEHTAMACVCLASKIEEAPRRARDIINVFTHIRQVNSGEGLPKKYSWVCQKHPVSQQNAETPSEGIGSLIKLEHDLRSMGEHSLCQQWFDIFWNFYRKMDYKTL